MSNCGSATVSLQFKGFRCFSGETGNSGAFSRDHSAKFFPGSSWMPACCPQELPLKCLWCDVFLLACRVFSIVGSWDELRVKGPKKTVQEKGWCCTRVLYWYIFQENGRCLSFSLANLFLPSRQIQTRFFLNGLPGSIGQWFGGKLTLERYWWQSTFGDESNVQNHTWLVLSWALSTC